MKSQLMILGCLLLIQTMVFSQFSEMPPDDWFHLDQSEGYSGVSTAKMYETLKGKKSQTVVVAVIDGGVDWDHEDLRDVMWKNTKEIPENGIDDDKNGYIDDIYGWNFLGNKNGENVHYDQLEMTRLYVEYDKKFKDVDVAKLKGKDKKLYDKYKEMEKTLKEKQEETGGQSFLYKGIYDAIVKLETKIGKEDITADDLKNFETSDPELLQAAKVLENIYAQGGTLKEAKDQLEQVSEYYHNQFNYYYNPDFDGRSIVGDDYSNSYEIGYGNNDVKGPDAFHGTHVSGIIASSRNNGIGMDGVADNVRIMALRAVPDGDERDKDVANAIIYAVDNGASVINMSFGKGYVKDKDAVDKAVKYAMKKDVLLIHAAGNDNKNTDSEPNFPNDGFRKKGLFGPKQAKNWLEIGALSWKGNDEAPARFSNFGKDNVDVFAPGKDIYSTTPDNHYKHSDGTSMAAPVAAGVAAVLRSYFPKLTAKQVKEILMDSSVSQTQKVKQPGSNRMVSFDELCVSGGTVNANKAVELASKTKGKKKIKKGSVPYGGNSGSEKNKVVKP